ncbi:MAG: hypothetical protein ACOYLS_01460 [Polymorphobacter sp.]
MTITAHEARTRYDAAMAEGRLVVGKWQSQADDGRHLACALGIIDPSITDPKDCPASVMPRWLAKLTVYFFDGQRADSRLEWGAAFYAELDRLGGKVPFTVINDWHANVLAASWIARAMANGNPNAAAKHTAYQALHLRALAGDNPSQPEWRAVTRDAYADAYADADADAYAYADADADADADAYAYAYADADAYADASADASASADAYADAYAYAYAYAESVKRQAFGMIDCLRRVPG